METSCHQEEPPLAAREGALKSWMRESVVPGVQLALSAMAGGKPRVTRSVLPSLTAALLAQPP